MRGMDKMLVHALAGQNSVSGHPLASAGAVAPGVVPTAPGNGAVFKEGGNCTFSWNPDPSGQWKQTDVELMTGDNFQMVHLTSMFLPCGLGDATVS